MRLLIIHTLLFCSFLYSSIIDIHSQDVHINKEIQRVIAIGPGALRLVTIMGLEDKVVGIEKVEHKNISFSEYRSALGKEKIKSLPIIGAGGPGKLPSLEKLISLKPDIIVASFIGKKQLQLISNKTRIPIVSLSYGSGYGGSQKKLEAIKDSLRLLGKVFQKEQRAKEIVDFMNDQEDALKKYNITSNNLYIGGMGFKGAHGITSTEKNYPSFELLGIKNPLAEHAKSNHLFIQKESLIAQNPDMIFLDMFGKKIIKEDLKSKKALYETLDAYKQNKIHWLLAYNFYNTNVANVYINAWIILEKLGHTIDIQSKMKEVYTAFYKEKADTLMKTRYPIMKFK